MTVFIAIGPESVRELFYHVRVWSGCLDVRTASQARVLHPCAVSTGRLGHQGRPRLKSADTWLGPVVINLGISTSGWMPTAKSDADENGEKVKTPNFSLSCSWSSGLVLVLGLPSLLIRVFLSSR